MAANRCFSCPPFMLLRPALDTLLYLQSAVGPDRITVRVPLISGFADATSQEKSAEKQESLGFTTIETFSYLTNINKTRRHPGAGLLRGTSAAETNRDF